MCETKYIMILFVGGYVHAQYVLHAQYFACILCACIWWKTTKTHVTMVRIEKLHLPPTQRSSTLAFTYSVKAAVAGNHTKLYTSLRAVATSSLSGCAGVLIDNPHDVIVTLSWVGMIYVCSPLDRLVKASSCFQDWIRFSSHFLCFRWLSVASSVVPEVASELSELCEK